MLGLALLAAVSLAQAAPAAPDLPPPALAAHLRDGMPDPDDAVWMRGAFAGASAADKADWDAIQAWVRRCFETGTAKVRRDLAALGVAAPKLGSQFAAPVCIAVADLTPINEMGGDWDRYLARNRQAKARLDPFLYGARLGFESAPFDPAWANAEARTLMRATVREQVYRKAFSWQADGPRVDPEVWQAMAHRITLLVTIEDGKNTAMLRTLIAEHGWPSIPQVGERASDAAWLLAQHADLDPVLQYQALRLMEPLVASGGVTKANYAYLHDRVMLKFVGTQRYGTQATCVAGTRVPLPLEPGNQLDARRAEVGLDPIADYMAELNRTFGPCPPDKPVEAPPRAP